MAQLKYTETLRLRKWDLMACIGILIVVGVIALIQVVLIGSMHRNVLLLMALGILLLSGVFYYLYELRFISRYNEKSIKLSMMPAGTITRKIKWEEVAETEFVSKPRESRWSEWNSQLTSLDNLDCGTTETCLHLKLKNNEEISISCSNPEELHAFVEQVKDLHPGLE
jgi:hypothetical protein